MNNGSTETISYYNLVEVRDFISEEYNNEFWTIMKLQEFAHIRKGNYCFLEADFHHYRIVEFEFYNERELNVFKLKHPDQYSMITFNHELFENNKHRMFDSSGNKMKW